MLPLPGEPLPVRLMNSIRADRPGLIDDLRTVEGLRAWLAAAAPSTVGPAEPLGEDDLSDFRSLRDALRRLASLVTDDPRPAAASATREVTDAVAAVNEAAALTPVAPLLAIEDGVLLRGSATGASAAARCLSGIAAEAVDLLTGHDRPRLRACLGPGCVLYFVKDHPRREWCGPACGNRARAARHYARHRGA